VIVPAAVKRPARAGDATKVVPEPVAADPERLLAARAFVVVWLVVPVVTETTGKIVEAEAVAGAESSTTVAVRVPVGVPTTVAPAIPVRLIVFVAAVPIVPVLVATPTDTESADVLK
jgi:hypothetical protein